jgi:hypothetical protein
MSQCLRSLVLIDMRLRPRTMRRACRRVAYQFCWKGRRDDRRVFLYAST